MKKQSTKIKFVFESAKSQNNFYIKKTYSDIKKLSNLFHVFPSLVVVHVFQSRSLFLREFHKKKVADWVVAFVPPKNISHIYIVDDKERNISRKILGQVLLHETTHLYTNVLNTNLPDWLSEGIAVYVAAQIFKPSISVADWKNITQKGIPFKGMRWSIATKYNGYTIAGLLVMYFVRRYGWKKFITAISHHPTQKRITMINITSYFDENLDQLMVDFKKQFVK